MPSRENHSTENPDSHPHLTNLAVIPQVYAFHTHTTYINKRIFIQNTIHKQQAAAGGLLASPLATGKLFDAYSTRLCRSSDYVVFLYVRIYFVRQYTNFPREARKRAAAESVTQLLLFTLTATPSRLL